jgi:poly(A) polymerase
MNEPEATREEPSWTEAVLRLAAGLAEEGIAPAEELTLHLRALAPQTIEGDPALLPIWERVLLGASVEAALQWLHQVGLLPALLPELAATVDFTQEMGRRHKDVWKHTKQVVAQCVSEIDVRWAALLHDIGKVPTRALGADGKVTFHGHAEVGARMFDRVGRRLALPKPLRTRVRFLILNHLRANQYDGKWTDSAVRRFDREMGEHLDPLLQLSRADITSASHQRRETALSQIEDLVSRIASLREIDAQVPPLPSGLGNHIIEHYGLAPGKLIGDLRKALELAVTTGELEPNREPEYYLEQIRLRGLLPPDEG